MSGVDVLLIVIIILDIGMILLLFVEFRDTPMKVRYLGDFPLVFKNETFEVYSNKHPVLIKDDFLTFNDGVIDLTGGVVLYSESHGNLRFVIVGNDNILES